VVLAIALYLATLALKQPGGGPPPGPRPGDGELPPTPPPGGFVWWDEPHDKEKKPSLWERWKRWFWEDAWWLNWGFRRWYGPLGCLAAIVATILTVYLIPWAWLVGLVRRLVGSLGRLFGWLFGLLGRLNPLSWWEAFVSWLKRLSLADILRIIGGGFSLGGAWWWWRGLSGPFPCGSRHRIPATVTKTMSESVMPWDTFAGVSAHVAQSTQDAARDECKSELETAAGKIRCMKPCSPYLHAPVITVQPATVVVDNGWFFRGYKATATASGHITVECLAPGAQPAPPD
jgi:hypothetical protein